MNETRDDKYPEDQIDPLVNDDLSASPEDRMANYEDPNGGASPTNAPEIIPVLELDGADWAIGLEWMVTQEQSKTPRETRKEARLFATSPEFQMDADLFCITKTANEIAQYGFGNTALGHEAKLPALAPVVAAYLDKEDGNALAVVKMTDRDDLTLWWVVAVANGAINADYLTDDEEDAKNFCRERVDGLLLWSAIHAPQDWNMGGETGGAWDSTRISQIASETIETLSLLEPVNGWARLTNTSLGFLSEIEVKHWIIGAAAVIGIGGFYGYGAYQDYLEEQRWEQLVRDAQQQETGQPGPDAPVRDPLWAKAPSPSVVIGQCLSGVSNMFVEIPGWELKNITCAETGITSEYAKTDGSTSGLYEATKSYGMNEPDFDATGSTAFIAAAFNESAPRGPQALLVPSAFRSVVADFFQRVDHTVSLSQQKNAWELSWETETNPADWKSALDNLPGAVLRRLQLDPSTYKWSFTVKAYVWAPPPPPPES